MADALLRAGVRRAALFGTAFTAVEGSFFDERLRARGLDVVLDAKEARAELHRIIYDELTIDEVTPAALAFFATLLPLPETEGFGAQAPQWFEHDHAARSCEKRSKKGRAKFCTP